jgi:hypothetical protein
VTEGVALYTTLDSYDEARLGGIDKSVRDDLDRLAIPTKHYEAPRELELDLN